MISIDPKTQGIASTRKLKKSSDKKDNVKFAPSQKTQENNSSEATSNVADIGGCYSCKKLINDPKTNKILKNLVNELLIH
jgi:hypothetical protein